MTARGSLDIGDYVSYYNEFGQKGEKVIESAANIDFKEKIELIKEVMTVDIE